MFWAFLNLLLCKNYQTNLRDFLQTCMSKLCFYVYALLFFNFVNNSSYIWLFLLLRPYVTASSTLNCIKYHIRLIYSIQVRRYLQAGKSKINMLRMFIGVSLTPPKSF